MSITKEGLLLFLIIVQFFMFYFTGSSAAEIQLNLFSTIWKGITLSFGNGIQATIHSVLLILTVVDVYLIVMPTKS